MQILYYFFFNFHAFNIPRGLNRIGKCKVTVIFARYKNDPVFVANLYAIARTFESSNIKYSYNETASFNI